MLERKPAQPLNYQTPRSYAVPGESTCWRDESDPQRPLLVVQVGAPMPDRCVLCNAPALGFRQRRNIGEQVPNYFAAGDVGRVIGAATTISRAASRKAANVEVGLCPHHRRRERRNLIIGGSMIFLGIGLLGPATWYLTNHGNVPEERKGGLAAVVTAGVLFVAGATWLALRLVKLKFEKLDNGQMWIRGAGKPFLDSLPPLTVQQ